MKQWVTLSTDSDNNGYNNSVTKNAHAEFLERSFKGDDAKAKPITYFDSNKFPAGFDGNCLFSCP
ncbi:MAG: hypothetical protein LBC74_00355 [Planctomycetaceae bacterium]|nr:hypothetical protein [Planctomycetaceae bacterium]